MGGCLYAFGGLDEIGEAVAAGERLDSATDSWEPVSPPPTACLAFTTVVQGKLCALGSGNCKNADGSFHSTLVFDPELLGWQSLCPCFSVLRPCSPLYASSSAPSEFELPVG